MVKRLILMLVVMALVIAGLGFRSSGSSRRWPDRPSRRRPKRSTVVAKQEKWPATLSAIGTMAAVRGDGERRPSGDRR